MKPKRVKEILNKALEDPTAIQPLHIWGPPGIGKSAIPKQVCEEKQVGFVDMRLAQRDPTDLRGIPAVIDGKARWLPPPELPTDHFCLDCQRVLQDISTEKRGIKGKFCPFCGSDKLTDKGILFLDEMTSAPPLTQASAYQLTLDRRIGEYILPKGWYIIAAGNRIEDRAVVYRMSTALANRFVHLDFQVNLDNWIEWALLNQIDSNIIAFIHWRGGDLLFAFKPDSNEKAFATPRTWEYASKVLKLCSKGSLAETLEGTVGKGATAEFMSFLKVQTELPDINTIFKGDNFVPKRIDLKYALISALATKATGKQFERLLKYSEHLPEEFAVLLVSMLTSKDEQSLATAPSLDKWARSHADVLIPRRRV